jgi:hypothetical protein
VVNVNDYDDEGTVFGRPDQVELDVIIKNGLLLICELKSSIDKAGMYIFERKARFDLAIFLWTPGSLSGLPILEIPG